MIKAIKSKKLELQVAIAAASDGQGLAEYGLILAGVAVVAAAAINLLGDKVNTTLSSVTNALNG